MRFRVAVRAQHHAFGYFDFDLSSGTIGQRAQVQGKALQRRIMVVPCECSQIPVVPARTALAACFFQQFLFATQSAHALSEVALVSIVGVGIFAMTRTEAFLTPR